MHPFNYAFRRLKRSVYLLAVFSFFLMAKTDFACAWPSGEEETFFSHKRFYLNKDVIDALSGDTGIQNALKSFMESYDAALDAISEGDFKQAEKLLVIARGIWPEYFGTDFLLALVYEKELSYKKAARFYKSYLNKLGTFYSGQYRVSEQLIRSLSKRHIERYDYARDLVNSRLEDRGINMAWVLPAFTVPNFLIPSLLVVVIALFYGVLSFWVIPRFKRLYRFKNPPAGFWVCRHCDITNPELSSFCGKCGRER